MDLSRLQDPFPSDAIEWRVQASGVKNGKVWARVLAYIDSRAVMDRLDKICGPENWCNDYKKGPDGGILCGISIWIRDQWITKWDGASNTDIEAVKGGLSGASKRAAVQWGIGRYLYRLEATFAKVHDKGAHSGKASDKKTRQEIWFKWDPPPLPKWALPGGDDKSQRPAYQSQQPPIEKEEPAAPAPAPARKVWQDLSKKHQKALATQRSELVKRIDWGEDYPNGYDDWIKGKGGELLTKDPSTGKPSFSSSYVDQIERLIEVLEILATNRPKKDFSKATKQAATAGGAIDPTKLDSWGELSSSDLRKRLSDQVKQDDIRLHSVLVDAQISTNGQTLSLLVPVGYSWHEGKLRESIPYLERLTGLKVATGFHDQKEEVA